jgi:hypothetical protein
MKRLDINEKDSKFKLEDTIAVLLTLVPGFSLPKNLEYTPSFWANTEFTDINPNYKSQTKNNKPVMNYLNQPQSNSYLTRNISKTFSK